MISGARMEPMLAALDAGCRAEDARSTSSSRATTPWMHEVGFTPFDASKYASCGIGRVRPQLVKLLDTDLRAFAEKDEQLQRVVEIFARKFIRSGEGSNTTMSTLTDMMWCVLTVVYFAILNNQIPSLLHDARAKASEEARAAMAAQLLGCRKEYLEELTSLRDQIRHFTPEMEQVLAECADVPTYRFEPNHALDAETAAFVNQVVEEKLKLAVLRGAHRGYRHAETVAHGEDEARRNSLQSSLDASRSKTAALEAQVASQARRIRELEEREASGRRGSRRGSRGGGGDDGASDSDAASDAGSTRGRSSRGRDKSARRGSADGLDARGRDGAGADGAARGGHADLSTRLSGVEPPFPAESPRRRRRRGSGDGADSEDGLPPLTSESRSRTQRESVPQVDQGVQCTPRGDAAATLASPSAQALRPLGANGAGDHEAQAARGRAAEAEAPAARLRKRTSEGEREEDPRVPKLLEENKKLKAVIEELQLRIEQLVARLRESGLGGADLDAFLQSSGLAAVLEQRKLLGVFERLYADAQARRGRQAELRARLKQMEEKELLLVLASVVTSMEEFQKLEARGVHANDALDAQLEERSAGSMRRSHSGPLTPGPPGGRVTLPGVGDAGARVDDSRPLLRTTPLQAARESGALAELRSVFGSPAQLRPPSLSPAARTGRLGPDVFRRSSHDWSQKSPLALYGTPAHRLRNGTPMRLQGADAPAAMPLR